MNFSNFKEELLCLIFPKRCIFCGKVIENDMACCKACMNKLPQNYIECFARGAYRCVASFPYSGVYRDAVINMKFRPKPNYAKQMAVFMAEDIMKYYGDVRFHMITAVPLHMNQKKKRGYNQSEILARKVAEIISVPYEETLLKYKDNKRQHTLKGRERIKNVAGVYKPVNKKLIKNKNILVIDDVITTGCTLGECSKVLFNAGANLVCTAAFCRSE